MRVPEISLGNGLHAQNKHDLCRTISIQNDIDKLNTFQLTQFHLWWCQVCRAWEFKYKNDPGSLAIGQKIAFKITIKDQKKQKRDSFWEAYGTMEIIDDIFDNHRNN